MNFITNINTRIKQLYQNFTTYEIARTYLDEQGISKPVAYTNDGRNFVSIPDNSKDAISFFVINRIFPKEVLQETIFEVELYVWLNMQKIDNLNINTAYKILQDILNVLREFNATKIEVDLENVFSKWSISETRQWELIPYIAFCIKFLIKDCF